MHQNENSFLRALFSLFFVLFSLFKHQIIGTQNKEYDNCPTKEKETTKAKNNMGNELSHSIPGVARPQNHECFHASVLLVDAPPSLHGFDLAERKWMLAHSVAISIVRWDSKVTAALNTDQLRLVLNRHAAVVLFDVGLGTSRTPGAPIDPITTSAIKHLSNVLSQVSKGQAERTMFRVIPLRVSTAATLYDVDSASHAQEYVASFARRCNLSADVAARLQFWNPQTNDEVARFLTTDVLSLEVGTIPKELLRPLKSLLTDLVETVEAREGHLLESSTLLPIASSGNERQVTFQMGKLRQRAVQISNLLRQTMLPTLSSTQSHVHFASMRVGLNSQVYVANVVPNTLCVVLIVREQSVGEALVRLNCAHFAAHFTHVVTTTNRISRLEPLRLPELNHHSDEMDAAQDGGVAGRSRNAAGPSAASY